MSDFKFEVWPTEFRQINQYFAANPQNYQQFGLPGHEGIDIRAPMGTKIFSVAPGRVTKVRTNPQGHNYGIHVEVSHSDGYKTIYAHLQEASVRVGQMVQAGTTLGLADNTGNSFGSHLHLTLKKEGAQYQNWPYNILDPTPFLLPLMGWQKPAGPYVEGWAYTGGIFVVGDLAQVGSGGINLRRTPRTNGRLIDLVPEGTLVIVTGGQQGEYRPVKVSKAAIGVDEPTPEPTAPPPATAQGTVDGWAFSAYLTRSGDLGTVGQYGINLRAQPTRSGTNIGLVRGGETVTVLGDNQGEYHPVRVRLEDFQGEVNTAVAPTLGSTAPSQPAPPQTPTQPPIHDTTPGWAFTAQVSVSGSVATAGQYGINLRAQPRRNGENIGFVPAKVQMIVTGTAQGEYTPVRVDDDDLQRPFDAPISRAAATESDAASAVNVQLNPDPIRMGNARIGLHASADPDITDAEHAEFAAMRPTIIKVLSFHPADDISRLAKAHPNATWVLRTFLDFGGRNIRPSQFVNDTLGDTKRALNQLQGKNVVIELHNEPNLVPEGMGSSWKNGREFRDWWLELLGKYRQALPGHRFIYPGLSPGPSVGGLKQDHVQFIESSRDCVHQADGLGVHIYWSNVYPMSTALGVLDDYVTRFRGIPIWVTEASNNKGGNPHDKGREYIRFWQELQKRPTVQGVTYFVASASNPQFGEEVWVGRGIGKVVGGR